ncbi:hypothetical protein ACFZBU_47960, partial [Embleya sp. NPDC008237]|uniref:hypothetical protein n=1 Tax=Embleya sp. NPDC008237 TaxID=3363978 RepID=UPI0036E5D6F2
MLFERLVDAAFRCLGSGPPTVLTAPWVDDTAHPYTTSPSWETVRVSSWESLSGTVATLLPKAPVLLVLPWERLTVSVPDARGRERVRRTTSQEVVLRECVPQGPESLLAVLLPAGDLSSLSGAEFR